MPTEASTRHARAQARDAQKAAGEWQQATPAILEGENHDAFFEAVGEGSQLAGLGNPASQCFLNACVQSIKIPLRRLLQEERKKNWFEEHCIFDLEGKEGANALYILCRTQEDKTLVLDSDPRLFANNNIQQDTMECLRSG